MSKPRIAFLGLGTMGAGMAGRLLSSGFPLTVFNRDAAKTTPFVSAGACAATSARDAASGADIVISMVADDTASRSVWQGDGGALSSVEPGAVCVECSTLTIGRVQELAGAVETRGCAFLDAPVTGSKLQAATGELNFIVGGSATALEKVRPVLAAMGKKILPLGPVGSGALLKLINNFVCGVQVAALAEALAMIERSGLDRTKAMEIIGNGAPGSPLVKAVSARMMEANYTPHFHLRLMAKDLGYAIKEGSALSVELKTAVAALDWFQRGTDAGRGTQDIAALFEVLRGGGTRSVK